MDRHQACSILESLGFKIIEIEHERLLKARTNLGNTYCLTKAEFYEVIDKQHKCITLSAQEYIRLQSNNFGQEISSTGGFTRVFVEDTSNDTVIMCKYNFGKAVFNRNTGVFKAIMKKFGAMINESNNQNQQSIEVQTV